MLEGLKARILEALSLSPKSTDQIAKSIGIETTSPKPKEYTKLMDTLDALRQSQHIEVARIKSEETRKKLQSTVVYYNTRDANELEKRGKLSSLENKDIGRNLRDAAEDAGFKRR